jgi:hypothetical protein
MGCHGEHISVSNTNGFTEEEVGMFDGTATANWAKLRAV